MWMKIYQFNLRNSITNPGRSNKHQCGIFCNRMDCLVINRDSILQFRTIKDYHSVRNSVPYPIIIRDTCSNEVPKFSKKEDSPLTSCVN